MKDEIHYRALESMYLAGPINEIFKPQIRVEHERAEIEIEVKPHLYHSAGAVHGSVYFKMLDDAAFFAANSIVADYFVLTTSFTIYLMRPISSGRMKSIGRVLSRSKAQIIAQAEVFDRRGKVVGSGSGTFVRGRFPLEKALGYERSK